MKREIAPLIFALLFLFCLPAHAAGPYFSLGVGASNFKTVDTTYVDTQFAIAQTQGFSPSSSVTNTAGGVGKLLAGYQFNKYLGIEGGYIGLGESNAMREGMQPGPSGANTTSEDTFTARQVFDATGAFLTANAGLPISSSFSIFAKGGVFRWHAENNQSALTKRTTTTTDPVTGKISTSTTTLSSSSAMFSDSGTAPIIGAGISYKPADRPVTIRAEFERFKKVGRNETTGESDIDAFSIALILNFL